MAKTPDNENENPNPDEDDKGGEEVQAGAVPSLDQIHARTQAGLEAEEAEEAEDGEGEDEPEDEEVPDAGAADDEDVDEDEEPETPAPEPPAKPADDTPSSAPELDTDIHKNGPGKIAMKNFDGETLYFNSLDEVPDDFEPANYKEMMKGVTALQAKSASDAQASADRQKEANEAAVAERQKELNDNWDKDIAALGKSGELPKDKKEADAEVNATFEYMEKELNAGRPLDNFKVAFYAMKHEQSREAAKTKDKETAKGKQSKGAVVQSGGGGPESQPSGGGRPKTRVLEGPPSGISLDQAHQKAISDLS